MIFVGPFWRSDCGVLTHIFLELQVFGVEETICLTKNPSDWPWMFFCFEGGHRAIAQVECGQAGWTSALKPGRTILVEQFCGQGVAGLSSQVQLRPRWMAGPGEGRHVCNATLGLRWAYRTCLQLTYGKDLFLLVLPWYRCVFKIQHFSAGSLDLTCLHIAYHPLFLSILIYLDISICMPSLPLSLSTLHLLVEIAYCIIYIYTLHIYIYI